MKSATTQPRFSMFPLGRLKTSKEEFRAKFQRSLRACVRRGFSIEESFGMIWVETWDEFSLSERDESELYDELMQWAKTGQLTEIPTVIHRNYSQKIGPVSANLR